MLQFIQKGKRAYCETQDLKSDDMMLDFEATSVIEDYVRQQEANPPGSKDDNGHPVYESRSDFGSLRKGVGVVKISDFGAATFGNVSKLHYHDIQPVQFCAPEVMLKAGWTYSADIWNLGMVVSVTECRGLFISMIPKRSNLRHSCGNSYRRPRSWTELHHKAMNTRAKRISHR